MKKIGMLLFVAVATLFVTGCSRPLIPIKGNSSQMSLEEAKVSMEPFINDTFMQGEAKIEIKEVIAESGIYKIILNLGSGQETESYVTKDGKIFFPQGFNVEETKKKIQEMKEQSQKAAEGASAEIPKSDKPTVDLYVMSFCPYGNEAEETLKSVYNLLKNKVTFNFHYIVSVSGDAIQSLHGEKEVAQNEREACVLKNYGKDKWFSFVSYVNVNCGSDGACWEAAAKNAGLNAAKIGACVSSQGATLMKENEAASTKAGANGSPTMIVNGVSSDAVYKYGDSESYKQAICGAFKKAPTECSKVLNSQSNTKTQGASCGN